MIKKSNKSLLSFDDYSKWYIFGGVLLFIIWKSIARLLLPLFGIEYINEINAYAYNNKALFVIWNLLNYIVQLICYLMILWGSLKYIPSYQTIVAFVLMSLFIILYGY